LLNVQLVICSAKWLTMPPPAAAVLPLNVLLLTVVLAPVLYMPPPSLAELSLTAEAGVTIPDGEARYGDGFACANLEGRVRGVAVNG